MTVSKVRLPKSQCAQIVVRHTLSDLSCVSNVVSLITCKEIVPTVGYQKNTMIDSKGQADFSLKTSY